MSPNKKTYALKDDRRIRSFDVLKAIVIMLTVTWGHYWQFTPAGFYADGTSLFWTEFTNNFTAASLRYTHSLMELLFIISGFQMYAYYSKISEGTVNFVDYLKKRVVRLFPLTIITTLFMFVVGHAYYLKTGYYWFDIDISFRSLVLSLLNVQNWFSTIHPLNGPLWYVSVYFLCLVLYYPMVKLCKKLDIGILPMLIPVFYGSYLYLNPTDKFLQNSDVARGYFAFFLGVIAAHIFNHLTRKQVNMLFGLSVPLYLLIFIVYKPLIYNDNTFNRVLISSLMLYIPTLMFLVANPKVDAVVGNKPFAALGKASYCLYAINFPFYMLLAFLEVCFGFGIPYGKTHMYYVMFLIQIIVAILINRFIEPGLNKYFAKKLLKE
ncbi:MAG: acyltransferase [Saccharofermentans sp.]|nr:acyltransferase [Saccharofermentans sp.]